MLNKMSLKMKLGVGFGTLLLIAVIVAGVGYYATFRTGEAIQRIVANADQQNLAMEMVEGLEMQTTGIRGFLLAGKEELLRHDQDGQTQFNENADKLEPMLVTEHGKKLLADARREFRDWRAINDRAIQRRREGKTKEAEDLVFSEQTSQSAPTFATMSRNSTALPTSSRTKQRKTRRRSRPAREP